MSPFFILYESEVLLLISTRGFSIFFFLLWKVLWALHQSGMLDIILYISSSANENAYYLHILEILSFMLREQNASELAHAALQRSQTEKIRDEAELLAIRHKEINDKQKKAKAYTGTR